VATRLGTRLIHAGDPGRRRATEPKQVSHDGRQPALESARGRTRTYTARRTPPGRTTMTLSTGLAWYCHLGLGSPTPGSSPTAPQPSLPGPVQPGPAAPAVQADAGDDDARGAGVCPCGDPESHPSLAHNLTYGCSRLTTQSIRCRPGWTDKVYIYAAAVTFGLEPRAGQEYVTGTLSGLRATTRACLARASVRSCAHSFRWAV
jgi:hypothetical protein